MNPILNLRIVSSLISVLFLCAACDNDKGISLFDGETLDGWECPDDIFRVEDGAIVGGYPDKPIKQSQYLCTTRRFADFELNLKLKFRGDIPMRNAGVSFRAERIPGTNHVGGYQADAGYANARVITMFSDQTPDDMESPYPLWGILVDEFRPNTSRYKQGGGPVLMLDIPDRELVENTIITDGWNEFQIIAVGPSIKISINGVLLVDYTESDSWVPRDGLIGLQMHSGEPHEVLYKDIFIREL